MRVIWSELASLALQDTADYLYEEFGEQQQEDFLFQIDHLAVLLELNPHMGKVEPLLTNLPHEFRSIVANHYNKLIYLINDDLIEIVDFWDTRRDPMALVQELKNL